MIHFRSSKAGPGLLGSVLPALAVLLAAPAQAEPTIEFERCELVVPGTPLAIAAQCGWLGRPENPDEPDGRRIQVHVARVPARGRVTEPDPLVFFAGGPGQAASETWPVVADALSEVNENRDILLVDQRGTGKSNPLKCPEMEIEELLAMDWGRLADSTRECLDSLDADVRYYTTTIAMHDIDAARAALGYEKVNLFGGSYGTRAAQVYLRLFPERVRTVVLDGVVPQTLALGSEHAQKLDQAIYRVLQGCEEDPHCSEQFSGTAQMLKGLMRTLDENPRQVTVEHPTTGEPYALTFNREILASALRFLTYSSETQAMLPLLIHEAATEQHLERLASQMMITATGLQQSISQGMELSVMCAEDAPFFPRDIESGAYLMGNVMLKATRIQCEVWPRGPVPAGFHDPVTADVPALLMSGELDPVTPPEYGDRVAAQFPRSTHLIAPGQGHIVTTRGCMGELASEFIASGDSSGLDTDCMAQIEASPYFLSLTGPQP